LSGSIASTRPKAAIASRERPSLTRANLWPALWLGVYAVCISFGYQHIGAAAQVRRQSLRDQFLAAMRTADDV
jgi:hypothetical protein